MNITFTNVSGFDDLEQPQPASKFIPNWYKNMESKCIRESDKTLHTTVKRCMPVFDAMTNGYIITTYADIIVKQFPEIPNDIIINENTDISTLKKHPNYEFSWDAKLSFHPIEQAPTHPSRGAHDISYPKWNNPWAIKTPPGYSTMFVQPMHRESVFTILPGIVDTDEYYAAVHFPFVLNNADTFEGIIPAGTPMVQVIPFKRDNWKMEFGNEKDNLEQEKISLNLKENSYKSALRKIKTYK